MTTRPNSLPFWCTNNPSNMSPPSQAQVQTGWLAGQPPSAEVANQQANSVGNWIAYLDSRDNSTQLASSLDFSTRLVGGGAYSLVGTTLAWSAPFFVAVPSQPDANNTVAAGSITLPSGSVAYVTANMPFSTTAATTTGSKDLTGVLYGDQAAVGQLVTGAGIPSGTQVTSVSADGQTVSLSQAATASASGVTVTFSSSGTLTPQVAASATFVPGPNAVVFARGLDTTAIVGIGTGQMLLRQGESKQLLGHGYTASATYPAGVALGAGVPVYISPGSADGGRTAGALYPLDVSATSNALRSQLAGFTAAAAASGALVEVVAAGRLGGFAGLTPGNVYYAAPTAGQLQATAPAASGQWVVPAGMALTATQLLVWNGTPATLVGADRIVGNLTVNGTSTLKGAVTASSISSAQGFKSRVELGGIALGQNGSASSTAGTTYPMYFAAQNGITTGEQVMGTSGSITSVLIMWLSTAYNGTLTVQINGATIPISINTTLSATNLRIAIPTNGKGVAGYTFNAGDYISAKWQAGSNNPASLRIAVEVELSA